MMPQGSCSFVGMRRQCSAEDEAPMFVGDDAAWQCYKEKEKVVYPEGKNPIMQLNEVYHGLKYSFLDQSGPVHNATFKVAVELENVVYEGMGNTKKNAKLQAAMNALQGLNTSGYLTAKTEQLSQQRVERMEKRRQWLTERKDRLKKMVDQYRNRPKKNPPLPQNAIGKLNDRFKGLKYSLINQDGPLHNATFAISLNLCNQVFVGTGNSKKVAKLDASNKAMHYLGMTQGEDLKMDTEGDATGAPADTDAPMESAPDVAETTQPEPAKQLEASAMVHAPALPTQVTTFQKPTAAAAGGSQEQAQQSNNQQSNNQQSNNQQSNNQQQGGMQTRAGIARARASPRGARARGRGQVQAGGRGGRGRGRGRGGNAGNAAGGAYTNPYQQYKLEDSFRSAGVEGGNQDYNSAQGWGYGDAADDYNKSGTGDQGTYESYSTGGGGGGGGSGYLADSVDYSNTGGDYVQDSSAPYDKSYGAESW